jgi:acyl-CoA thioesterase I
MPFIIYFFGSGLAFYVGVGLILFGVLLTTLRRRPKLSRLGPLAAIVGVVLVTFSAAPLPYWYFATAGFVTLVWLFTERPPRNISHFPLCILRIIVVTFWLVGVVMDGQYQLTPTVTATGRPAIWIIGDSVTAGLGNSKTETWPRILARTHDIVIHDHSQAGATVATALRNLPNEPLGDGIVLLEIGGNDLLGSTTAADFEDQLDRLLTAVCQPHRTVLMFELPLPPFCNRFGMAQRRLAAEHGVLLIPKRLFVEVLTAEDTTLDGVHLSQRGHEAMAEMVWGVVAEAYGS